MGPDVDPEVQRLGSTPEGEFRHEQRMYVDKCLRIREEAPQTPTIRRGPGLVHRGGHDAGGDVRPHRRRRRRRVPEPGAADERRGRRAAGRALGARTAEGQGVPPHRTRDRRTGGLASGHGEQGRPPRRAGCGDAGDGRGRGQGPAGDRRTGQGLDQPDRRPDGPARRLQVPLRGPPLHPQHGHGARDARGARAEVVDEGGVRRPATPETVPRRLGTPRGRRRTRERPARRALRVVEFIAPASPRRSAPASWASRVPRS
ncbi:MAG: hypothetical protein U5R31_00995 [Acidimicrobiia bacterium]|nr:hypothetical protein [Acidimicrobiia bacterium]